MAAVEPASVEPASNEAEGHSASHTNMLAAGPGVELEVQAQPSPSCSAAMEHLETTALVSHGASSFFQLSSHTDPGRGM